MADYIAQATYKLDDQVSAGANAAADALDRLATAAETTETKVTRTGTSAARLANTYDDVTRYTNQLQRAQQQLTAAQTTMADAVARGAATAEQQQAVLSGLQAKVDSAAASLRAAKEAQGQLTNGATGASEALSLFGLSMQKSNVLIVDGTKAVTELAAGMPVAMVAMQHLGQAAYVFDGIGGAIAKTTGFLFSLTGALTIGGVAALGAFAIAAESANERMLALQNSLRATRNDYAALAAEIDAASRAATRGGALTIGDARSAGQTIASAPDFHGATQDLTRDILLANNLAAVMGQTVPEAAKTLAEAFEDPAKVADELANRHFPGVTKALADTVKAMEDAGNTTDATTLIMRKLSEQVNGAAGNITPFRQALLDLDAAWHGSTSGAIGFGTALGNVVVGAATFAINALTKVLTALQDAAAWIARLNGATVPTTPQQIALEPLFKSAGGSTGVDPALLARLQGAEGVYDSTTGTWKTSVTGAVGPMQVLPSTFQGMLAQPQSYPALAGATNLNDVATNVNAGAALFGHLLGKYGDVYTAVLAYHDGEAAVDRMLQDRATGNTIQAALDVSDAARDEANRVTRGYTDTGWGIQVAPGTPGGTAYQLPTINVTPELSEAAKTQAQALIDNSGTQAETAKQLQDHIDLLTKYKAAMADQPAVVIAAQQAIQKYTGQLNNLRDPVQEAIHNLQLQAAAAQGTDGASRTLAQAMQQLDETASKSGQNVSVQQQAEAQAAVLAKLSAAFRDEIDQIGRATAAQVAIGNAYAQGGAAVQHATDSAKAYEDQRKNFIEGSPAFQAAVEAETAALDKQAQAQAAAALQQATAHNNDQVRYIQAETASLGENDAERNRMLATLQAEIDLRARGIDVLSKEGQAYIDSVAHMSDANYALQHAQQVMQDLANTANSIFDNLGTSITQAFVEGQGAAVNFGNIAKAAITQVVEEALKLAVINPLLNSLFGGSRTTLGDVTGLLGALAGGGGTAAAMAGGTDWSNVSGGGSVSGGGLLNSVGTIGSIGTLLNGIDKLAGGSISGALGINNLGASVSSLFAPGVELTAQGAAIGSSLAGGLTGAAAANAAAASGTASAVVSGQVAEVATIGSTIAQAIPYIGAAIGVISDLVQGNYRGAALVGGGAAIGTAIAPGIGTAIGAALGGLVDAFLPSHPLHPFAQVDILDKNGRLAIGNTGSQLEDNRGNIASAQMNIDAINKFLDQMRLYVVPTDPADKLQGERVGIIGNGIQGVTTFADVAALFSNLRFSSNEASNYGLIAAADLPGKSFADPTALAQELTKIATFAANLDGFGITLKSLDADFKNITVASVHGSGDFETALAHDLPGKTFADDSALAAEIQTVNEFVNGTIPSLVNATGVAVSSWQQQIDSLNQTYSSAEAQAAAYGLSVDSLVTAQNRLINMQWVQANKALDASEGGIWAADQSALGNTEHAALIQFNVSAQEQRDQLLQTYQQYFGAAAAQNDRYLRVSGELEKTLADERAAIVKQYADQAAQNLAAAQATDTGYITAGQRAQASILTSTDHSLSAALQANGINEAADLADFDAQAAQTKLQWQQQLQALYGAGYATSADYARQIADLDASLAEQRLAIEQKYADQAVSIQGQAASAANSAVTSLAAYIEKIQTGQQSPLDAQHQYALASSQFDAVFGAAQAGDANSISNLTTYADAFLQASQNINGSGVNYAADFSEVVDRLAQIASLSPDTLTASFYAAQQQQQTDTLNTTLNAVLAAINGVRSEIRQQGTAPARIAA